MKYIPTTLLFIVFVICISCNNKKPGETVTYKSEDGKEQVTIDVKNMEDAAANMDKVKEELSKLTPLTNEQLNALLPAQLMGAARTDLDVTSNMGTGVVTATYQVTDSSRLDVTVIDCAGPAGAGIFTMQYLGMMNIESNDEDEYIRTIDFNGRKAFESCEKVRTNCTLTYFTKDRFLVSLEAEYIGIEKLKQAANALNMK